MKLLQLSILTPTLLACILLVLVPTANAKERMGPEVGGAFGVYAREKIDVRNNGANESRQISPLVSSTDSSNHICGGSSPHHTFPCETDVDSPEMLPPVEPPVISGRFTEPPMGSILTEAPTLATSVEDSTTQPPTLATSDPTESPTEDSNIPTLSSSDPTESPVEMTEPPTVTSSSDPTAAPTPVPTELASTIDPTSTPTALPTVEPTSAPLEPCTSTDGTFGVVSGTPDTDISVSYMYEMETMEGTSMFTIETIILPQLEKAIVDSLLAETFPSGCSVAQFGKLRRLRKERRLTVTGITMNPPDQVNDEFVCDSSVLSDSNNGCNIIDGELTLYTTNGQASPVSEKVTAIIRENMNSGAYSDVNEDIVRLTYLDTAPSPPEANTGEGNTGTDGNEGADSRGRSNELRVGLFVGLFGLVAIIAGVVYRTRRTRHVDDETDMQTNNDVSAIQSQAQSYSLNDARIHSCEESVVSYDESGMVMADTGMDSASTTDFE